MRREDRNDEEEEIPGREEAADVVCNGVGNDEDGDGAYSSSGEVVSDTMENSIRVFPVLNIKHSFAKCRSEFTNHFLFWEVPFHHVTGDVPRPSGIPLACEASGFSRGLTFLGQYYIASCLQ